MMEILEAISGRRSVREYSSRPVAKETIDRLIEAAVAAPSAVNEQPWTFTAVQDRVLLDRISQAAKAHMLARPQSGHFRKLLSDPKFQMFYHAPVLLLISAASHGPWIVEDCALAAENLMLAAFAEGLGSCWIGFAQGYLATAEGKQALGLPDAWVPVAPIIVGHPKAVPPPVPRNKPEVKWVG